MRTKRGRRQVASTLHPGAFWVFRNLCVRVGDGDLAIASLGFDVLMDLIPRVVTELQSRAGSRQVWKNFTGVTRNNLTLGMPTGVSAQVNPSSWWCSNCYAFYTGQIGRLKLDGGKCPRCKERAIVQMPMVFICPVCHRIDNVEAPQCPECGTPSEVILVGTGGRRREYRWKCRKHPSFELRLARVCQQHPSQPMVLKSTGGLVYFPERLLDVTYTALAGSAPTNRGGLNFTRARAQVSDILIGRRPVADTRAYYRGQEFSPIEPFINPATGSYTGYVSMLDTNAIIVTGAYSPLADDITLHSLKHALLNAAPAATGLTQEEFGASYFTAANELVIYDNVSGGTGGCRLLSSRRLNQWLTVARELAECNQMQCEAACRACLFLPSRVCRQNNQVLDRKTVLAAL